MKKSFRILTLAVIMVLFMASSVFANVVNYYDNGKMSAVIVDSGVLYLYENGNVASLNTNKMVLNCYENGYIGSLTTEAGVIYADQNGNITSAVGNAEGILEVIKFCLNFGARFTYAD